jgi:hypothetical protein
MGEYSRCQQPLYETTGMETPLSVLKKGDRDFVDFEFT